MKLGQVVIMKFNGEIILGISQSTLLTAESSFSLLRQKRIKILEASYAGISTLLIVCCLGRKSLTCPGT